MTNYSAKNWAGASFQLTDGLIGRLQETGVLSKEDVEKLRNDAIAALEKHWDHEFRTAADLLRAIYQFDPATNPLPVVRT